jgi:hypothetical protein
VPGDDALRFAERLVALLDATRYTATYKLATVLALIDVAAEHTGPDGRAPVTLSAKEVARRVIELYWPQTVPYSAPRDMPTVLSQSPQKDIPAKLAAWRTGHHLGPGTSLEDARAADRIGWAVVEADLVAVVVGMPLAKLQRFGEGHTTVEDRFIYDFNWREEVGQGAVNRPGFDDRLVLRPDAAEWLVRLAPLIRPLVQAKWAARVAARNPELVDAERLDEFLFGAQRINMDQVRDPLAESQDRACFYCAERMTRRWDVDHFLPWSRHPDNTLDNLVAAHAACNGAKSSSLAAVLHLDRWINGSCPAQQARCSMQWPQQPTGRVVQTEFCPRPGPSICGCRRGPGCGGRHRSTSNYSKRLCGPYSPP